MYNNVLNQNLPHSNKYHLFFLFSSKSFKYPSLNRRHCTQTRVARLGVRAFTGLFVHDERDHMRKLPACLSTVVRWEPKCCQRLLRSLALSLSPHSTSTTPNYSQAHKPPSWICTAHAPDAQGTDLSWSSVLCALARQILISLMEAV